VDDGAHGVAERVQVQVGGALTMCGCPRLTDVDAELLA
jgi:hypothetical protein